MNHIESYGYTVISKDNEILEELRKNDYNTIINWFNFNQGDIYYSDDCIEYYIVYINHDDKSLELSRDIKDLL